MSREFSPHEIEVWKLEQDYRRLAEDKWAHVWVTLAMQPMPAKRAGYDTLRSGYKRKALTEFH